jgi:pre-mRNA-splicing factor 18
MDALKAVVAEKRKAIVEDNGSSERPNKYMRRGEIERLKEEAKAREEKERRDQEEAARLEAETKKAAAAKPASVSSSSILLPLSENLIFKVRREQGPSRSITNSPLPSGSTTPLPDSAFNISEKETIRRLRAKGQPIRLFAESDKDRRLRLRALELIEEKGSERQGGQNDFKKALEDVENVERELQNKNNKGKKKGEAEQASTGVLDLGLVKSDPDKLYPLIYYALKRTLKEWEEAMDERPGRFILSKRQLSN